MSGSASGGIAPAEVPAGMTHAASGRQGKGKQMADNAPEFGTGPFTSEIQMSFNVSDDKKAITMAFDNFQAILVPRGPPIVMRTFSFVLPLKNVAAGAKVKGAVQGSGVMNKGTGGMLIFRAAGVTQAFDTVVGPNDVGFMKEINLVVPAGGDLRMTIILALETNPADPGAEASVNVSTVDLELSPAEEILV